MFSVPPATAMSTSPERTSMAATLMASRPEEHWRLTAMVGVSSGIPALREERRGGVPGLGGLEGVAHDDFLNHVGRDVGALEGGLDCGRSQVGRGNVLERSAEPAHGRPGSAYYDCILH